MTEPAQLHPDLTWREVDDSVLVLDLNTGKYLELNSSGALLWKRVADGTSDVAGLSAALQEEFDVDPEQAERDVVAFLASLRQAGLLV